MPRSRSSRLLLGATALSLAAVVLAAPGVRADDAEPADATAQRAAAGADVKAALGVLERAERLRTSAPGKAKAVPNRDATLIYREVLRTRGALSGADRARADAVLARPSSTQVTCSTDICVHWSTTGPNAPSLVDTTPANSIPDYVDRVVAETQAVHDTYVASGYRAPKGDGAEGGGTDLVDVYLEDLGEDGLYGYCRSDDPAPGQNGPWDAAAYCGLDNDYRAGQFPTNSPIENLQVTVAHEYFHAVQFAYDAYEDGWLLEATAAWVEDEMFDGVDDNLQYIGYSPISRPDIPVDYFGDGFHYGTWTFFRYLTEKFPTKQGALPKLVLDIFKRVDGAAGGPDQYSWQGLNSVLKARGTDAATQFGQYAAANRRARQVYSEGRANNYPSSPLAGKVTLGRRHTGIKPFSFRLDHLTSATFRVAPKGITQKKTRLRFVLDLSSKAAGAQALVTTYAKNGKVGTKTVKLSSAGKAQPVVPFSNATITAVEITIVNASARFTCWRGSPFSCQGAPRDDDALMKLSAKVLR